VKTLNSLEGLSQREKDFIIGTSIGISQGITGLNKEYRDRNRKKVLVEDPTTTFETDLALDTFDFNIHGESREEVLGKNFGSTRFVNPGSRQATRLAIFQRVVDDPNSSDKARQVAFTERGWEDHPKLYQQNVMHSAAKVTEMFTPKETSFLVPTPVLGTEPLTDKVFKTLKLLLPDERNFDTANRDTRPLKEYLTVVELVFI
jgi:hypothetical protein